MALPASITTCALVRMRHLPMWLFRGWHGYGPAIDHLLYPAALTVVYQDSSIGIYPYAARMVALEYVSANDYLACSKSASYKNQAKQHC